MSECYIDEHQLIRDGRSQADRSINALMPSSVQIDDRKMEDILEFVSKYARQVIYYGLDGSQGDWTPFFENIVPVQIALISKFDLQTLQETYQTLSNRLADNPNSTDFNLLQDQIATIFQEINRWQHQLKKDESLGRTLRNLIKSDLSQVLRAFIQSTLAAQKIITHKPKVQFFSYQKDWHLSIRDFIEVDTDISSAKGDVAKQQKLREKLDDIFQTLFKALEELVGYAPAALKESLSASQSHPAHLSLLLAFLRLFEQIQADINTVPKRHLDFFYRDILQLKERAVIPDQVHLIFELASKVDPPFKLEKDTLFKDGEDANGVEVQFGLDEELVVDKAQVVDLRTLFFQKDEANQVQNVFVAPVANSADGKGADFTIQPLPSWETLGSVENKESILDEDGEHLKFEKNDIADFGIAFASEVLFLKEGKRKITVTLTVEGNNIPNPREDSFLAYLSSEKEWIKKEGTKKIGLPEEVNELTVTPNGNTIKIELHLSPEEAAVTAYNAENLEDATFPTTLPILKLMLNPNTDNETPNLYHQLRDLKIKTVNIQVEVHGAKEVLVQNDLGLQDGSNVFMPFGPTPKAGSNFYIGSQEVFLKHWNDFTLSIDWEVNPVIIDTQYKYYSPTISNLNTLRRWANYRVKFEYLNNGIWQSGDNSIPLFSDYPTTVIDGIRRWKIKMPAGNITPDFEEATAEVFTDLGNNTNGFIRFVLKPYGSDNDAFLVEEYPQAIIRRTLAGNPNNIPLSPYIPAIKNFYLDYTATSNAEALKIFHLYPFEKAYKGEMLQQNIPEVSPDNVTANPSVLPDFRYQNEDGRKDVEGSLFIGVENLEAGGQLNLLFQIAAGSADPDTEKASVDWHYLANNEWQYLRPDIDVLSDATNGLLQSGIVKFALPWDINTENTILPNSLHWLRASVQDHVAAIGETLSIHAQAGKLTFRQQPDNDLQRLSKPLAAEQIAKPVENIAPLKGILQAYPSFGGRPKETREHFYTRVSERLRHKGRAITIYDYERLVLQNFPSVYKAKCVTHTLGQRGKNGQNHTHAPGFVTLIVVPDLTNLQVVNRFAPKVPLAMLEKIEAFLKSVSSPFVRIKVLNPRYEAVDVAFEVKFKKGKSENFYRTELRKSIRDFLTPWASEGSSRIVFGGKLFQSTIINFIENQTYVDYLKNFEMKRQLPSDNISDEQLSLYGAKEEISGLTANSVLNAGKINVRIAVVSPQQNEMVAYKINGTAIGTAEIAG